MGAFWATSPTKPPAGTMLDHSHPLAQGMTACWLGLEGDGTFAHNLTRGADMAFTVARWQAGPIGRAWGTFTTDEASFLTAAGHCGLDGKGQMSVEAWFNFTARDTNGGEVISVGNNFVIRADNWVDGFLAGFYWNGAAWVTLSTGAAVLNTGWKHVVYTARSGAQSIAVNGRIANTAAAADVPTFTAASNGANTFIGKHGNADTSVGFGGQIALVRLWDRVLAPSEIASLYAQPFAMLLDPVWTRSATQAGVTTVAALTGGRLAGRSVLAGRPALVS